MKGFFGIFNQQIFELKEPTDICITARNKPTGIEKVYNREGREFRLNLNISNAESNMITNKEFFEDTVLRIKEENIKEIPTLAPRYRVLIDYMLYNNSDNIVVDEGVITKMIEAQNAFLPLGLDPENNELVYRVVKQISGAFDFIYRTNIPFGIMKHATEKLTLYINRVQIQQAKTHVGNLAVDEKACRTGIVIERGNPNATTEYNFIDTYVTIFDTLLEGMKIEPVETEMVPRKITIDVNIILNNYFYTSNPDDVLQHVQDNIDAEIPEPTPKPDPVEPTPDPGETDKPETTDPDKTDEPSGDNTNPDGDKKDDSGSETEKKDDKDTEGDGKQEETPTTPSTGTGSEGTATPPSESSTEEKGETTDPSSSSDSSTTTGNDGI